MQCPCLRIQAFVGHGSPEAIDNPNVIPHTPLTHSTFALYATQQLTVLVLEVTASARKFIHIKET